MRLLRNFALSLCVCVITLAVLDVLVRGSLGLRPRLTEDFSAAYFRKVVHDGDANEATVVLGDSVLWGYRLTDRQIATERLRARGIPTVNLAFEGGSTANVYAVLVALRALGAQPRRIVFNVNIKSFNPADSAYATLHPSISEVAWPYLSAEARKDLKAPVSPTFDTRADHALSRLWALYGMRSDIRERVFGASDAASAMVRAIGDVSGRNRRDEIAHRPTADRFIGTYDLSPLGDDNVQVRFLRRTVALLHDWHVPALAILTPTNHTLLHEYIDVPEYAANERYLRRILEPGVKTIDLDHAFAGNDFIDNDHLTAAANDRFAALLASELRR